ncbi:DUF1350 family protein [Leptolyngbya sp. FACHB-321]|uniref:DUF1350 family protein n=1 Tax=Leptolyngbya sp. FACHB-321 TaxID=2692807 RepID=UPI0016896792|nr:DUF1350 family protein [Leptolyngbya sp. FACHB-321]MBD2034945.1 DUF1350 family protein [Leptolyngbya sp. FACHB-321]
MQPSFRFQPLLFSWVALHPKPKGVIQFVGGAFFGSFPTLFYRYFLSQLFEAGYTIVALPFRFTFRHWSVALSLLDEQQRLQPEIIALAARSGYETDIYQHPENYTWIGHSLGCKYIALLELLSDDQWQANLQVCTPSRQTQVQRQQISDRLGSRSAIRDQRSLLLAPDISDTESAIPIKPLAKLLDRLGLGVLPDRQQTLCLIDRSRLFNLTSLISFDHDTIAGSINGQDEATSDVLWLVKHLERQHLIQAELAGKHLEPIGVRIGQWIVDFNPLDKFIKPLWLRDLEPVTLDILKTLEERSRALSGRVKVKA